jgi:chromosome segregation ATPase
MSPTNPNASLDEAIARFTDTEQALQAVLAAAHDLDTATGNLRAAQRALADAQQATSDRLALAQQNLDHTGRAVASATAAVVELAARLEPIASELRVTAEALRSMEPERLWEDLAVIREDQRGTRAELSTTQAHAASLRADLSVTRAELAQVQSELADLRTEHRASAERLAAIGDHQRDHDEKFEHLRAGQTWTILLSVVILLAAVGAVIAALAT